MAGSGLRKLKPFAGTERPVIPRGYYLARMASNVNSLIDVIQPPRQVNRGTVDPSPETGLGTAGGEDDQSGDGRSDETGETQAPQETESSAAEGDELWIESSAQTEDYNVVDPNDEAVFVTNRRRTIATFRRPTGQLISLILLNVAP